MNDNQAQAVNPFAPPQAEVADIPVGGPALAAPGRRLLAAIIDMLVAAAGYWAVAWLFAGWWPGLLPGGAAAPSLLGPVALSIGLFLLIQGPPLVRRGQTVGKLLLRMRIVRSDGSRVGPLRLLGLRYGLGYLPTLVPLVGGIWALVDVLLIYRRSRQCLHDQIADTIVIDL